MNEEHTWDFYGSFLYKLPNKLHIIKHLWVVFLHFKDLVNDGQILNFYRHFIYKNFAMSFKICGFVGLTG